MYTYRPATSTRRIACGKANPSKTGTACVTPSPESSTIPVVLPDAYLMLRVSICHFVGCGKTDNAKTAWIVVNSAGTLNVSKKI